jgi:hypothetical protein
VPAYSRSSTAACCLWVTATWSNVVPLLAWSDRKSGTSCIFRTSSATEPRLISFARSAYLHAQTTWAAHFYTSEKAAGRDAKHNTHSTAVLEPQTPHVVHGWVKHHTCRHCHRPLAPRSRLLLPSHVTRDTWYVTRDGHTTHMHTHAHTHTHTHARARATGQTHSCGLHSTNSFFATLPRPKVAGRTSSTRRLPFTRLSWSGITAFFINGACTRTQCIHKCMRGRGWQMQDALTRRRT